MYENLTKEVLLGKIDHFTDSQIINIDCKSIGSIPYIFKGPRFGINLNKNEVKSLICMGYKVTINSSLENEIKKPSKIEEVEVVEEIIEEITTQETIEEIQPIVDEVIVQEVVDEIIEEKEFKEDTSSFSNMVYSEEEIKEMTKVEMKAILDVRKIKYGYHDTVEILSKKIIESQ
jgi:hypothetical protein